MRSVRPTLVSFATLLTTAMLAVGCSGKAAPPPEAAPHPEPVAAEPVPDPEPAPPPEPVAAEPNVDLQATLSFVDGTEVSGHLIRIERSQGFYEDKGWTDKPMKWTVTLEDGTSEIEKTWDELKQVDIAFGGPEDVDCSYDSSFTPTQYICVLRTTTTVTLADGGKHKATGRHKWKFIFEGGAEEAFWIYKIPLRRDDPGNTEDDTALQIAMRDELLALRKEGRIVNRITIGQ